MFVHYAVSETRCVNIIQKIPTSQRKSSERTENCLPFVRDWWGATPSPECTAVQRKRLPLEEAVTHKEFQRAKLPAHCCGGLGNEKRRLWHLLAFCAMKKPALFGACGSRERGRLVKCWVACIPATVAFSQGRGFLQKNHPWQRQSSSWQKCGQNKPWVDVVSAEGWFLS